MQRWLRIELALVLAEATGHRIGAVSRLRWEDIDFGRNEIRWRAEYDKQGFEGIVPMAVELAAAFADFRRS